MMDSAFLESLLQTAHLAVWRAGQVVRADFGRPRGIRQKTGPRDLVTDTDPAAQAEALAVIRERHPDHHILAEEMPEGKPDQNGVWSIPSSGVVWMVDPLDGTTNFTVGLPLVCTSVGVAVDGQPVAGAIYDPLRGELFLAAHGLGATLNGRPIGPLSPVPLGEAVVGVDWSHAPSTREQMIGATVALARQCRTIRAIGSAALALAYSACGRVQLYYNFGIQPWDVAAGAVLIREVGGDLCRPQGSPWHLGEPWVMAGHPALLQSAIDLVGNA